jgi:hypothetical protein
VVRAGSTWRWPLLLALGVTAAIGWGVANGIDIQGLLCLAPALVLAGALLARRYPGERLLLCLSTRRRRRRIGAATPMPALLRVAVAAAHGTLLMGLGRAERAPPLPSA